MSNPNPDTSPDIQELRELLEDALARAHQLERELDEIKIGKFWRIRMRSVALRRQVIRAQATVRFGREHGAGAFWQLVRGKVSQAVAAKLAAVRARMQRRREESVPVSFEPVDNPLVSVIVYGEVDGSWAGCLRSLRQNVGTIPVEVITDVATGDWAAVAGRACGRYLCFLSNRAEVHPGWLESLLRVMGDNDVNPAEPAMLIQGDQQVLGFRGQVLGTERADSDEGGTPSLPALTPKTQNLTPAKGPPGLVGSKLLYSDIRLKEAGGILWRDATRVSYGRGDMPDEPQYSYRRPVDFCSGDSLLVRRELVLQASPTPREGVPTRLAPTCAWWDIDLCFLARQQGFQVVYQPKSRVTIHEPEPKADDLRSDTEFTRQAEFEEKWRGDLVGHLPHDGAFVERAARRLRIGSALSVSSPAGVVAPCATTPEKTIAPPASGGVGGGLRISSQERTGTEAGATLGKTILIVDSYVPLHDRESGSLRLYQIIRMLREMGHSVTFLPDNGSPKEPYTSQLQDLGVETLYTTSKQQNMAIQLADRLTLIDIAWLCRPEICAKYLPLVRRRSGLKIIYDTIDLHFLRMKREEEVLGFRGQVLGSERADSDEGGTPSLPASDMLIQGYEHGTRNVTDGVSSIPSPKPKTQNPKPSSASWRTMQSKETALARASDVTLVVSPVEKEILEGLDVHNVWVLPNIHPIYHGSTRGFETRQGLLFIGGYNHLPNVDAVVWMAREIMPLLWKTMPDLTLTLLGSSPSPEVLALAGASPGCANPTGAGERVVVAGYVPDVDPYFLENRVFVAPLRYGAGMKGKVGQSLAYGLPVVTTDIGAEGIGLTDGYDVLIANTAEEFAGKVVEAYQDPALWEKLSVNGRELMRQYEPERVARTLEEVILS